MCPILVDDIIPRNGKSLLRIDALRKKGKICPWASSSSLSSSSSSSSSHFCWMQTHVFATNNHLQNCDIPMIPHVDVYSDSISTYNIEYHMRIISPSIFHFSFAKILVYSTRFGPPVVSWFLTPIHYEHSYHHISSSITNKKIRYTKYKMI